MSGAMESNPKLNPEPHTNMEKDPDQWVSGEEAMTGAQASYLKTLSEEVVILNCTMTISRRLKHLNGLMSSRRSWIGIVGQGGNDGRGRELSTPAPTKKGCAP